jgi:hypothetical protein
MKRQPASSMNLVETPLDVWHRAAEIQEALCESRRVGRLSRLGALAYCGDLTSGPPPREPLPPHSSFSTVSGNAIWVSAPVVGSDT